MTQQSNPCKCIVNKRNIKDNDKSAISFKKCKFWFHGPCVSLSGEDVDWLGARKNCKWISDICDSDHFFPSGAKLTIFNETLPSFRDFFVTNKKIKGQKTANEPMHFLIKGLPENANFYLKLIESDTKLPDKVNSFMGLKSEGNIVQERRLGKFKNPANNERRLYKPILITSNGPCFIRNCFARNHYLKTFGFQCMLKSF